MSNGRSGGRFIRRMFLLVIVALIAFFLGVRYSSNVRTMKGWLHPEVAQDSPADPYSIHVGHEKTPEGKLKTVIVGIYNGKQVMRELGQDLHTRRVTDELFDKAKEGFTKAQEFLREKGVMDKLKEGAVKAEKILHEKTGDEDKEK